MTAKCFCKFISAKTICPENEVITNTSTLKWGFMLSYVLPHHRKNIGYKYLCVSSMRRYELLECGAI